MISRDVHQTGVQRAFELGHDEARGFADFIISPTNRAAFDYLLAWPRWPYPASVLYGPEGSGKSHLARIWAARCGAKIASASDTSFEQFVNSQKLHLVIEDIDHDGCNEEGVFHMFNLCIDTGGALLVTSSRLPVAMLFRLADLSSRVRGATLAQIDQPDDGLIEAVIVKLFADRQLEITPVVAAYAAARIERSLSTVRDLVTHADRMSLETSRSITKPLVNEVLNTMEDK